MERPAFALPLLWTAALVLTLGAAPAAAHSRSGAVVSFSVAVPLGYVEPAPIYTYPQPVYVQPSPVYVPPQAVYVSPPAVYVQPQPTYAYPNPVYVHPWPFRHHHHRHGFRHHGAGRDFDRDGVPNRYDHFPRNPRRH